MEHVYWQVTNPQPIASSMVGSHTHVTNFGWHRFDGHSVHRLPMDRPDGLLAVTVRGSPQLRHGQDWHAAHRGAVSLYLVGEEQEYYAKDTWEAYWYHLVPSPSMLAILADAGITRGTTWPGLLDDSQIESLSEIFACERMPSALAFYRATMMSERLLHHCLQERAELRRKPRHTRLAHIADYARLHAAGRQTVSSLARMANLSPSRFAHLFQQEYGMSVGAYVMRARMEIAKRLLRTSAMTAAEVGYALGYQTPYAFYHAFKRSTGVQALRYRQSCR
jgi:AraC family transcriptional regulator of arabinose operon